MRRRSICKTLSRENVLSSLGVVFSGNISDRFPLGVRSKIFLRYFQFFSHERSCILVHKIFGDEIRACFYAKA
jgi:hypothetical protein